MFALKILPLAIIFHCSFSLYMYGNPTIFPINYTVNNALTSLFGESIASRIEKPSGIYNCFLILAAIFLIILLIFLDVACRCCLRRFAIYSDLEPNFCDIRSQIKQSGLDSYDIRLNPNYSMIVNAMDSFLALHEDTVNKGFFDSSHIEKTSVINEITDCKCLGDKKSKICMYHYSSDYENESGSLEFSRDSKRRIMQ